MLPPRILTTVICFSIILCSYGFGLRKKRFIPLNFGVDEGQGFGGGQPQQMTTVLQGQDLAELLQLLAGLGAGAGGDLGQNTVQLEFGGAPFSGADGRSNGRFQPIRFNPIQPGKQRFNPPPPVNNRIPTAPSSSPASGGDYHKVALDLTNKYRKMHGAGPLTLDNKLNQESQAWAERLAQTGQLQHSQANGYGENLYMMGGQILDPAQSAANAVNSWYNEVKDYSWNNPTFGMNTGHFTALVWKGTTKMGIGLANNPKTRSTYVVARYVPPANMMGAFKQNVGPRQ